MKLEKEDGKERIQVPETIVRDAGYSEHFVRRAFGGLQPDATFVMSLFDIQFVPDDNFKVARLEKSEKCKLTMTKETARSIAQWILKNIEETEGANKKPKAGSSNVDGDPMVR